MLSYRHAYHAGNFADILKHLVLTNTLHYATRKVTPLLYIDTHAGAGQYRLDTAQAQQTGEAAAGILKLDFTQLLAQASAPGKAALQIFQNAVNSYLERGKYPGSPLLAAGMLRRQDHLHLCELHSTDYRQLLDNTKRFRGLHIEHADGYFSINALLPPVQKRAVILIDPSYEVKDDFQKVVRALEDSYQRMPAAQVLLWYPVVQRATADKMISALMRSKIRDLWQYELGIAADNDEGGMTASGILAVNPPWTLAAQLQDCLPLIKAQLAPESGHWIVRNLVPE